MNDSKHSTMIFLTILFNFCTLRNNALLVQICQKNIGLNMFQFVNIQLFIHLDGVITVGC